MVSQNRWSAARLAAPMTRPGGTMRSARQRASRASRRRLTFSSLGHTSSASRPVSFSSSRLAYRNPSASRTAVTGSAASSTSINMPLELHGQGIRQVQVRPTGTG
jgi:hypothetical protein